MLQGSGGSLNDPGRVYQAARGAKSHFGTPQSFGPHHQGGGLFFFPCRAKSSRYLRSFVPLAVALLKEMKGFLIQYVFDFQHQIIYESILFPFSK